MMAEHFAKSARGPRVFRRIAKGAAVALTIGAFGVAGFSGVLAKHGDDDWNDGTFASGGSGGSGVWDDDVASGGSGNDGGWVVVGGSGGSGGWDDDDRVFGSGGSGGDDDWLDD